MSINQTERLKWVAIGIPPEDVQFLQAQRLQAEEVARWFHVPAHMIAAQDAPTPQENER